MVPTLLLILLTLLLVGLLFLVAGLRGRRVNNHPVCRQCRFDLLGIYPETVTCPECGAGLKRDGSVQIGMRRRSPSAALLGLFLIGVTSIPYGVIGYAALTGTYLNRFKPVGLLLWEAGHATPRHLDAIATELMNRALANTLSPQQYQRVIEHTLAAQADLTRPWSEAWGDLIERAKLDGVLSKAQEAKFRENTLPLELVTRETARAGATIPVLIRVKEYRGASGTASSADISLDAITIGGKPAEVIRSRSSGAGIFGGLDGKDPSAIGSLSGAGSLSRLGVGMVGSECGITVRLPDDLQPGEHPIRASLLRSPSTGSQVRGFLVVQGFGLSQPPTGGAPTPMTLGTSVQVVPADGGPTAIAPTEDTTRQIREALAPENVVYGREPLDRFINQTGRPTASIDFGSESLPVPIAFDVWIKDGDAEHKVGSIMTGKSIPNNAGIQTFMASTITISINGQTTVRSRQSDGSRSVTGPCPAPRGNTVDVILRPSSDAAENTLNQSRYLNAEIVYRNVPVQRDPFGGFGQDPFRTLMPRNFLNPAPSPPRPGPR